jgi:hypothetical protein
MVNSSFYDVFMGIARAKRYEPIPRLCAGKFGYVAHRFPIKNGISMAQVMAANIANNSPLYQRLIANSNK